jgi:hypothetical protein
MPARKLSVRKKARGNPAWVKGHNGTAGLPSTTDMFGECRHGR